jgi:hypothetical protein
VKPLTGVPNRRELLREARRLGWRVEPVPSTGEVRVWPPGGNFVTLNNRRKQGTRALIGLLRKAERSRK